MTRLAKTWFSPCNSHNCHNTKIVVLWNGLFEDVYQYIETATEIKVKLHRQTLEEHQTKTSRQPQ